MIEDAATALPQNTISNSPTNAPAGGSLYVWDNSGHLTNELISRYRLTSSQITQFSALKAELVRRMQVMDLENATVQVSPDRLTISISIKADPSRAKELTEYYHDSLERILGPEDYADLAKFHSTMATDELANAGLLDKEIKIDKIPEGQLGPLYRVRAESRLKVSPPGFPPAYDTRTRETIGSREKIAQVYAAVPLFLPKDF